MDVRVIKITSKDELKDVLASLYEELKKEEEDGKELAEARYDKFIDVVLDFVECILNDGEFKKDCAYYREKLHKSPLFTKRAFFKCFSIEGKEIVEDITELVAECVWTKKSVSNEKGRETKVKDNAQTKKEKKNSNH